MLALLLLLLEVHLQMLPGNTQEEDRFRLNCPQDPCWHYWNGNCYCLEPDQKGTWTEALKLCKRYRYTELVTLTSFQEKNWILDLPLDDFWIGLNNLEEADRFSWSEGTEANMSLPWLQLSHPIEKNTMYCVKVSKRSLIALECNTEAHWICKRSADVDHYQEHEGKVLLSPPGSPSQVHADLIAAKTACLELRERCTGITVWNNAYALARGTVLLKSEESQSAAYIKSDCSLGYFGRNCSSVCSRCNGDELCNPYTGICDNIHSCRAQDSPAVCEQALESAWCPHFSGWKYWGTNCYYFSTEAKANWTYARKQCRRFRSADLMWIDNPSEITWIYSTNSSDVFWTGLNSRKQVSIWVWSDIKSAAKELHWLKLRGSPSGRCIGLDSVNFTTWRLNCNEEHRWICKRKEVGDLFDVYLDRFLSGPLEPMFYTSISKAAIDCLSDTKCTGIVQDYQYFRRTRGINAIITDKETATAYVRRECAFGFYGYNCASECKECYEGFKCNSVTGECPERMECVGKFKGELCELGIRNPKCPQNAPWWFYDDHCYYFEKEKKGPHAWANVRCSYYKDSHLARIDSENEKKWLGKMLEAESWIGLQQKGITWKWSDNGGDIDRSKYSWLWDFPATANGCAQMLQGGTLRALPCSEQHLYICKKEIDVEPFIDYPGKIMLALYAMAVYKDLAEAKIHCVLRENCTGISSWTNEHFLVTGMEVVSGSAHHIFHLKTSCLRGRHGPLCSKECPECRDNALCNMLTGWCDEKSSCEDQSSIESCSRSTVSERCPDMKTWRYWNKHCYYFSMKRPRNWKEANSSCSRFRTAELLWVDEENDLKWLMMFFKGWVWLGLHDIDRNHVWTWSHNDPATSALEWMEIPKGRRWRRCTHVSNNGAIRKISCKRERDWVCKRPAERDLDIYAGFWDSVVISPLPISSANLTYNEARDECIQQEFSCLGFGLWQSGYFTLNGLELVGGSFGPSVTFLKSACDYGYYGSDCQADCPQCHWDKPCHPVTGTCEGLIACAAPRSVGSCFLGLYSLKCPLGTGWWYWKGKCYLIEKNRKVMWKNAQELCRHFKGTRLLQLETPDAKLWLRQMISEQMWIGMWWHSRKREWQWGDGTKAETNLHWLKIRRDGHNDCGTLLNNQSMLLGAKCREKLYFICGRQEDLDIFQEYKGHIIPQRQQTLPITFYTLEAAKKDCIFERTTCTGVVFSQGRYYMVSGKTVFKSIEAEDILYLKSVCNPGFYGTNCQFRCKKCANRLPCHAVTGECVGTSLTKCSLDSLDAGCIEAFRNPCPKRPKWHYYSKSCYYVENSKTDTWTNARIACQGFKGTDLVKITNSHEKMWVQYKGNDSWIGLTFCKQLYQYLWVDNSSSVFQNAWVIRQKRRYTKTPFDCGVAFKKYLSVTDCSLRRNWICKRAEDVNLFSLHLGRAFYLPSGIAPKYSTLDKAKQACLVLQNCTGVVELEDNFTLHTGMEIYNTRDKRVKLWIKSECVAGRFGQMCEKICRNCGDNVLCNPHTGLCSSSLFCNETDPTYTCKKGVIIGGRCPTEDGWVYWHGSCYYINRDKEENWFYAREMCIRYKGTDLLWIANADEKKALLSILPRGTYWSGLHGNWFCHHLHWSFVNASYTNSEWLRINSMTVSWRCCVKLIVPEGSMPGTSCRQKKSWICKKREEESMDFRTFHGYFMVGIGNSSVVNHKSLIEAFEYCRFERRMCTAVQRIRNTYITYLAKRLVFVNGSYSDLYTAYLKSACTPGYYGPQCSIQCTCNGTKNCNPLSGQCSENEQCNEDYLSTNCEEGVINLKCPKDPGWWYWKGNCYYIETAKHLTWEEANNFCMAYHETEMMPLPQTKEEKIWLTSVLKEIVWLGSVMTKAKDTTNLEEIYRQSFTTCPQINRNGTVKHVPCSSLAAWVCKRDVDAKTFWKYSGKLLILPLGERMYINKEHAKSACFLEEKCTGITYWKKQYVPVRGKELIITQLQQDGTYMKTACSEGHYGAFCQEKCPECPKDRPCNRLTGDCAGEVKCQEKKDLRLCEVKLVSKFCYHSWIYFNGHCYYISSYGQINKSDAEYMCSQYEGAQLLHLTTSEEKDWITKLISRRIWLHSVSPVFQPKIWLSPLDEKQYRILTDIEEVCLQLDPWLEHLISRPCSRNASWVCKAPLASEQVDQHNDWLNSMVTSLLATIIILVITVIVTYKYGGS
ncbi:hypothetical protein JRQ81_002502 [Phrynocephalus forsythii]|uniref:C-type lectin domain-containing protein n=1 Tax=Phrynocephalus forsythii TaxID=171643 RepID=A0A9Q0XJ11_9SAUR|nr:hypothetical protein JRQ81_002502 [Phrynocephalus forsythii]